MKDLVIKNKNRKFCYNLQPKNSSEQKKMTVLLKWWENQWTLISYQVLYKHFRPFVVHVFEHKTKNLLCNAACNMYRERAMCSVYTLQRLVCSVSTEFFCVAACSVLRVKGSRVKGTDSVYQTFNCTVTCNVHVACNMQRVFNCNAGLAIKNHPKKPKKPTSKNPPKMFFLGFFKFFYENNTNFSLWNRFFMNKLDINYQKIVRYALN